MYQINNEEFGKFLCEMRKEKHMTQKELGEKLFVSDKTVSKWERGASMPNVMLLIPIADALGITVTELLKGEKIDVDKSLNTDEVENLVVNSLDLSIRNSIRQHKKNWIMTLFIAIFIVIAEAILLTLSDVSISQIKDTLYISAIMLIVAGWFCIFAKDLLPTYYDKNKINYVSQGVFRIHFVGLSFNNGNWPYICLVLKIFSLGIAIIYPLACYACILLKNISLWNEIKDIFIWIVLLLMVLVVYIVGKKYE